MPYDAPCFGTRAGDLNGHYDVIALDAHVAGERIALTFAPRAEAGRARRSLVFVFARSWS